MAVVLPLVYQALVCSALVVLIYAVLRAVRPTEYSSLAVLGVLGVLGLLAVVNPIMGLGIRSWGLWLLYTGLSAVGGLVLIALAALLYDLLRPAGLSPSGPAAMGFMLAAFPFLLTTLVVLLVRLLMGR